MFNRDSAFQPRLMHQPVGPGSDRDLFSLTTEKPNCGRKAPPSVFLTQIAPRM